VLKKFLTFIQIGVDFKKKICKNLISIRLEMPEVSGLYRIIVEIDKTQKTFNVLRR